MQVGPIVGSTRDFYRRKLARCLAGEDDQKDREETDEEDDEGDEKDDEGDEEDEDTKDSEDYQPAAIVKPSPLPDFPSPTSGEHTVGLRRRLQLGGSISQVLLPPSRPLSSVQVVEVSAGPAAAQEWEVNVINFLFTPLYHL